MKRETTVVTHSSFQMYTDTEGPRAENLQQEALQHIRVHPYSSVGQSRLWLVFSLLLLGLFLGPASLSGCDESLLRILTADDPNGPFTQAITGFHKRLAELGIELKNQKSENHEKSLEGLMTAWLEFSNRYMVNPPEQARGDPQWQKKMEKAASRIGEIRLAIKEKRIQNAHDTVLALSTDVTAFFDCFGLSPLKRVFLGASSAFEECERYRISGNIPSVEMALASLTNVLATLTPRLTSETKLLHDRVFLDVQELQKTVGDSSSLATASFLARLENTRADFQKLRDRQLMFEWFSPPAGIVAPATPAIASESN